MINIDNRFSKLKVEFKADTGLEANAENMSLYIQYFNARTNDVTCQVVQGLTTHLLNELNFLPGKFRLEFADMLRTHEIFRHLQKN